VDKERKRVRPNKVKEPDTELGRNIKKLTGAPINHPGRTIRDTPTKILKQRPLTGKPN
jgi:hypothetical protein